MKHLIILLVLIPTSVFGQKEKQSFVELNLGVAAIEGYEFKNNTFPGCSFLFGQTYLSGNLVTEWQAGLALPTVLTGKVFFGTGNLDHNFGIGMRPWPLFIGPQAKLGRLTLSFEVGFNNELSYDAGLIATIGYRWFFKNLENN
tara:strand:- start:52 stop:483 length:432 start_codon:yes stop_codon:yes gene_type:complete